MSTHENPRLLSIGEAADRLGVSKKTLRRWEANGQIAAPGRTPGGTRLYTDEYLDTIRAAMVVDSPTAPDGADQHT